jgi:hypothetical protein
MRREAAKVYHQLLQADVEKQESEKVAKMKETPICNVFSLVLSFLPPASRGLIISCHSRCKRSNR